VSAPTGLAPMISIVDDDLSVRRALRRLVGSAGYAVETFGSAGEFLRSTPTARSSCLVLDIYLGGMSGFELVERLAADRVRIPTIFMTAHDDSVTRERIRRSGVAGYLGKPFGGEALLEAIRRVTGGGRAR
jgi:FixJ family two-component response regulator